MHGACKLLTRSLDVPGPCNDPPAEVQTLHKEPSSVILVCIW